MQITPECHGENVLDTEHDITLVGRPTAGISAVLLPAQRELLRHALADAIRYRDPPPRCRDCETLSGLCGQCAAGLSQARAYLALSRELDVSPADPDSRRGDPASATTR